MDMFPRAQKWAGTLREKLGSLGDAKSTGKSTGSAASGSQPGLHLPAEQERDDVLQLVVILTSVRARETCIACAGRPTTTTIPTNTTTTTTARALTCLVHNDQ